MTKTCTRSLYKRDGYYSRYEPCTRPAKYKDDNGEDICAHCKGADTRRANTDARHKALYDRAEALGRRASQFLHPLGVTVYVSSFDKKASMGHEDLEKLLDYLEGLEK